jgi:ribonuclease III
VSAAAPGADLDWLAGRLGWQARDAALAARALTHRSAGGADNERLEFLGDAVLSFVVAELLYREFADAPEGDLSRYRAALVSGEALADVAETLDVGAHLRLGPGELRSGGFRRRSILADAFEALLGAIYLDGGLDAARAVVERLWQPRLAALRATPPPKDPKTRLQEYLQARALGLPAYSVESISGEPHEQQFAVRCTVGALALSAEGRGSSRRRAEQLAAERVLAGLEARRAVP